ncbi:hypothetical protein IHE45_20G004500 [Dioscorea alata]|uniref:Uncharacterized protein n=2 Tax=Dioscorea alata TaxID=55571 RepID=A0ACB7TSC5_DIOAL|nr:hypothetical protein IHE45_20G004500 [Dioscorea alata]KAH7650672.1 hypothetical protein IHE45_20G004500 [Dioscorea alata]
MIPQTQLSRLGHVIAYYPTMNFHLLSRAEPWDLMTDLKSHLQMIYTQALWYCDLFTKSHSFPGKMNSCTSGISIGGHETYRAESPCRVQYREVPSPTLFTKISSSLLTHILITLVGFQCMWQLVVFTA